MSDSESDDDFDMNHNLNNLANSLSFLDFIEEGDMESVLTCLNMAAGGFSEIEDIYGCSPIVVAILAAKLDILQV